MVSECGGLFEYVTDRSETDIMAACKWKYAICEAMLRNESTARVLSQTHREQLRKYVEQGVVFRKGGPNAQKKQTVVQVGWEQR